jgi:hypothetical protein
MADKQDYTRSFTPIELEQIKELKVHMSTAFDAKSWNFLRDEAKEIWSEKIISAVDGVRKWLIRYDKPNVTYIEIKF